MIEVFTSMASRWADKNLVAQLPGGVFGEMPGERTVRPYAVFHPITEGLKLRTNLSRYDDNDLEVSVVANDWETAGGILESFVQQALDFSQNQLRVALARAVLVEPMPTHYRQEGEQYWVVTRQYRVRLGRALNRTPA